MPHRFRAHAWLALAMLVSLVPFVQGLSATRVFYIRDLALYFWPRHLSLLEAWARGEMPLWNSYVAGGQSAVADPLHQNFLLPVTLVRLLLPPVPGFNFWIAAPFPLLALGGWLWLRRYTSAPAAFVGAALLTVAGPMLSTGDFPNFSWSVAFIPWALWATDRLCERRSAGSVATLATLVALQAIAGEAVSFAGTCGLIVLYSMFIAPGERGLARARRVGLVIAGTAAGVLLSFVQTLPLLAAARHSTRAGGFENLYWSAHPLALLDLVTGHLFGHPHDGVEGQPWMATLNGGEREPLLFSIYIGIGAFALASIGRADREDRRWRWFWGTMMLGALVCALGQNTPIYPAVQAALPVLQSFRFPVKYLVFLSMAVAALCASGTDALLAHIHSDRPMVRPVLAWTVFGAAGALGVAMVALTSLAPGTFAGVWSAVARAVGIADPAEAAEWMIASSTSDWVRLAAIGAAGLLFLGVVWAGHRAALLAGYALCALVVFDPLGMNLDLNPTMPAADISAPAWASVAQAHPGDRVYVGSYVPLPRASRSEPLVKIDGQDRFDLPVDAPYQESVSRLWSQFAFTPQAWGVRQIISYDLPQLWPREYGLLVGVFQRATREDRFRFLRRAGVRYCFLPEPPVPGETPVVAPVAYSSPMALYECGENPTRVYVTDAASVVPSLRGQLELMFDARHDPAETVLLEQEAGVPAGRPGTAAAAPSATIVREGPNDLTVAAAAGAGGGYQTVLDSFDPDWQVEVDGQRAPLLRANGLFRAVRLTAGRHEVRFTYRPTMFLVGTGVSAATGLALLIPLFGLHRLAGLRRRRRVDSVDAAPYDALHEYR
jgi:hypothetical protein